LSTTREGSISPMPKNRFSSPRSVIVLSIAASIVTMLLKFGAYFLTGSVSLLSDAAESSVNLIAALVAFGVLTVVARPADQEHNYGHDKAEYFSSGVEGGLILVAAATIIYTAVQRFMNPTPLTDLGLGLAISLIASGINFGVSRFMLRKSKQYDSITLEADAHHLMTDVWTSVGVIAALAVVMFAPPSWAILDPIIAMIVGLNIIWTGVNLLRRSMAGMMDSSLEAREVAQIEDAIRAKEGPDAIFHGVRTRKSGSRRFIEFHLLVPGDITVQTGHDRCKVIEAEIDNRLANAVVNIHIEPKEDGDAWEKELVRADA
jgi:cation diffusion facilitator family transporter